MQMDINQITLFLTQKDAYIVQAFIVIFATLVVNFVQKKVFKKLHVRLIKTQNKWDDALVKSIPKPLSIIIWATGIAFAAEIIQKATKAVIFAAVEPARDTVVIFAFAWFLVQLIQCGENYFHEQEDSKDRTTIDAISKLLRISVGITSTLVILQTLGYSVSGILAFGGIGGIAIGFAAKDLLANFFGGLIIYLDRPFAIGDWIRSPDRNIEGTVEAIGWRVTRIRTFDKRPLYIPNSVFSSIAVENPTRMHNRRIYETIGIRYQDAPKMTTIIQKIKDMLLTHPEIDTKQTLIVNFNSFAPSSMDFFIYTFTKTTNWIRFHEIKQDVLLKIINIINEEKAETAFPTSTIYLAKEGIPPEAN
jgi:MscS family membrane protein